MQPLSPAPAPNPSPPPSGGVDSNKLPAADSHCFIYLQNGYSRVKPCRYRHDPADLAVPAAGSTGDYRHGSASSGIAKPAAGGTGGQCNGSDGTHNGSTSRVINAGTDSSSRAVVA